MVSNYELIRHHLKTFDIVLFSGKGGKSELIQIATVSEWSHVGMVVRFPQMQSIMLLESTTLSNLRDTLTGNMVEGVQLVYMRERIMSYCGGVAVRRLMFQRTQEMIYALGEYINEVKGRKYERNSAELVKSAYDGPFCENEEDESSLFCSELVAGALKRIGLLPAERPSNEYTPSDFASDNLYLESAVAGQIEYIKHREQAQLGAV